MCPLKFDDRPTRTRQYMYLKFKQSLTVIKAIPHRNKGNTPKKYRQSPKQILTILHRNIDNTP